MMLNSIWPASFCGTGSLLTAALTAALTGRMMRRDVLAAVLVPLAYVYVVIEGSATKQKLLADVAIRLQRHRAAAAETRTPRHTK
jgi:ABC-type transport system involved in cytochrome c biogenesis permease component